MEEINLNLGSPKLNVSGNSDRGTIKINMNDSFLRSILITFIIKTSNN